MGPCGIDCSNGCRGRKFDCLSTRAPARKMGLCVLYSGWSGLENE